jgi:hypothetical protein
MGSTLKTEYFTYRNAKALNKPIYNQPVLCVGFVFRFDETAVMMHSHFRQTQPASQPTNQPIPWSRVILEKLLIIQLVKEPEGHYHVHKGPPLVPILNKMHPFHNFHSISLWFILILLFHLHIGLHNCPFPLDFPTKILYVFLISLIRPTRPDRPVFLYFITLIALVKLADKR